MKTPQSTQQPTGSALPAAPQQAAPVPFYQRPGFQRAMVALGEGLMSSQGSLQPMGGGYQMYVPGNVGAGMVQSLNRQRAQDREDQLKAVERVRDAYIRQQDQAMRDTIRQEDRQDRERARIEGDMERALDRTERDQNRRQELDQSRELADRDFRARQLANTDRRIASDLAPIDRAIEENSSRLSAIGTGLRLPVPTPVDIGSGMSAREPRTSTEPWKTDPQGWTDAMEQAKMTKGYGEVPTASEVMLTYRTMQARKQLNPNAPTAPTAPTPKATTPPDFESLLYKGM